ncbi:unnamed protein product [Chrysodeixis includens]|uniref:Uncharacterized protein n=1 Tax=Chrysodeixis includens TaxID=689277 RepID=A0A9N8Q0L9_CHRIL|nr:unnamed protein product [Chrysodeixis includens]
MMLTTFVALQTLPWAAMSCAISQLDVLIYNFEHMKELVKVTAAEKNCDENEAFKEIFKRCVLHHCAILRFVSSIQAAFSGQLSSTLFISAGIVGTTGVQIFASSGFTLRLQQGEDITITHGSLHVPDDLTASLSDEFYFDLGTLSLGAGTAQNLDDAGKNSMHVATVVYSCPWIELPTHLKKNLVLFIAKTQVPLVITAAKLVPVSMNTFTQQTEAYHLLFAYNYFTGASETVQYTAYSAVSFPQHQQSYFKGSARILGLSEDAFMES